MKNLLCTLFALSLFASPVTAAIRKINDERACGEDCKCPSNCGCKKHKDCKECDTEDCNCCHKESKAKKRK